MSNLSSDPRRWRDERGQANLAERTAGETLRSLAQAEPLSAVQLARIAARVRTVQPRRRYRLVFVTVALLLGVATAASAAYLDILPSWIPVGRHAAAPSLANDAPKIRRARKVGKVPAAGEAMPAAEPAAPAESVAEPAAPTTVGEPSAASDPSPSAGAAAPKPSVPVSVGWTDRSAPASRARKAVLPLPSRAPVQADVEATPSLPAYAPPPAELAPPARPAQPVAANARPTGGAPTPALLGPVPAAEATIRPSTESTIPPAAAPPSPVFEPIKAAPAAPERKQAPSTAKLFATTVRVLRVEHDPRRALALLDRQGEELSRNALGQEALLLRVEALLDLGREGEVLRLLDGVPLTDVAASHSLLVTRGRLRAAANRCADAVGDFSLVLAESRKPDRAALFGRAVCRKRLGDEAGARADLERYRRELPTDPRLPELERELGVRP